MGYLPWTIRYDETGKFFPDRHFHQPPFSDNLWQTSSNIFQRLKLTLNETQGNIFLVKDKRNSGRGISENFTTTRPPCSTKGNPVPCFRYILSHDIRIEPKLVLFFLLRFFFSFKFFTWNTNTARIELESTGLCPRASFQFRPRSRDIAFIQLEYPV